VWVRVLALHYFLHGMVVRRVKLWYHQVPTLGSVLALHYFFARCGSAEGEVKVSPGAHNMFLIYY
jgi:hypothetical protein